MFTIALFEPEIPPNTGNIARLCVGLDIRMSIIGRPSFDLSEKAVRRAGLDYWEYLKLSQFEDWSGFRKYAENCNSRIFLITKFGKTCYTQEKFLTGDSLVFGRETSGLPEYIKKSIPEAQHLYIPMPGKVRSLNLSNAVAVLAYEAYRQITAPYPESGDFESTIQ